ncbi:MAG: alpha/beta hydrolase [Kiritimatiellales bacterium]
MSNLNGLSRLLVASVLLSAAALYSAEPEKMALWDGQAPVGDGTFAATNAFITVYHPEKPNGAAVVLCPGGGYRVRMAKPEGHDVARWLNEHGITGVVLEYRLPNEKPFVPLLDAQRALRTVRSKAAEWSCDPKKVGIAGFSAGGHLASTAATHFDGGDAQSADPVNRLSCRPDFAILVYPVITMGGKTHAGSKNNLLGKTPTPEAVELFSNEKQVTAQTPPTFLAHAQDDRLVPPDNSQLFFEALRAHNVPAEYLKLPSGGHGLNGYKGPMWEEWKTKALQWLAAQKLIPPADSATP